MFLLHAHIQTILNYLVFNCNNYIVAIDLFDALNIIRVDLYNFLKWYFILRIK